jgi:hypothetical protein
MVVSPQINGSIIREKINHSDDLSLKNEIMPPTLIISLF